MERNENTEVAPARDLTSLRATILAETCHSFDLEALLSPAASNALAGFVVSIKVSAQVPSGLAGENQPVVIKMLGASSNTALLLVKRDP